MTALPRWGNFYVIVGSSVGALVGLRFALITFIADIPRERDADRNVVCGPGAAKAHERLPDELEILRRSPDTPLGVDSIGIDINAHWMGTTCHC